MTRQALRLILLGAAVVLGAAAAPVQAQTSEPPHLLDVPYLPQSEDLCGGAAAAMVMRYWGAEGVYATAFAPLVNRQEHGIETGVLSSALGARGWTTLVQNGTPARIQQEIARGRPVIALIGAGHSRYHYVVVVAWAAGTVVFQDPAVAPLRHATAAQFERAWRETSNWMLTLLPPAGGAAPAPVERPLAAPPAPASCAALVDAGVAAANASDVPRAKAQLESAARACPQSSAPWRELAGLDALARNWPGANAAATRAVSLDPGDAYAWNLLGTAEYLLHDDGAALDAWNRAGRPVVDLVKVRGLVRTRYRIASDAADLEAGTPLSAASLARATRRLRDVPAFAAATVTYEPKQDGRADVNVAVAERDLLPSSPVAFAAIGAEALIDREVAASLASATGGGELATVRWRWWRNRPLVAASFAAPAPAGIGGVWRIDASRETQTFSGAVRQTLTHAALAYSRWTSAWLRLDGGAGVDAFADRGRMARLEAGARVAPSSNALEIDARISGWAASRAFSVASLDARWRVGAASGSGNQLLVRGGAQVASSAAPPFVWPGAGVGRARDVLLRARPLLSDGVIDGTAFGRRLAYSTVEWRHWSAPSKLLVRWAPAAFVDTARATRGLSVTDERTQVDVGAGLRFGAPGFGVVRVDLARGLRDGRTALSVAIER